MLACMNTPCLCTDLRQATRRLTELYDAALASLGINIAQYFLLRTIGGYQPVSLTELGRHAELDRSTVGRNVKVLERMELVGTGREGSDLREALVSLTPAGKALLRKATPAWERCQQGVEARLGAGNVEALRTALVRIDAAL